MLNSKEKSSIRIIHTADNHIGKKFSGRYYSPSHQERLIQERFEALERVVESGNERQAHFLVVSGDLFESLHVKVSDINATVAILNKFKGEAILVLPGNHDFYESSSDGLWGRFISKLSDDKIVVLKNYEPLECEIEGNKVVFYPAPCRSKHSSTHTIDWIIAAEKDTDAINIGIAHGNVEGRGFPGDKYFNMTCEELASANMDLWLLGHIHVPYPLKAQTANPGFFYAATHTPDGFDCRHGGCSWYIEINKEKAIYMEQVNTGQLRFHTLSFTLNNHTDIDSFIHTMEQLNPKGSLVKLSLSGRMSQDDIVYLREVIHKLEKEIFYLEIDNRVDLNIDEAYINTYYCSGTLPFQLLHKLSANTQNGLALQLANQLIEQLKK
ncbi:DNA repair exonuclease [Rhodocytophaga aerolata]|uniref:DNA repair exonuclease n=1 Tax=Rhodocytophaga aerolata TaxID=455078 RepID=A0ABT8RF91_9BACT|nr:DNA repair exonuclease [Rhodocytophaga aerolata]MDO1450356.1 DNA repair exonuclease [Rhodocytophaga aerolata]